MYYICCINNLKIKMMISVKEMSVELKAMWEDVNDGFVLPKEFYIHWLWVKYNKEVSFKDCLSAYKMCL